MRILTKLLFAAVTLAARPADLDIKRVAIIWNVGQGSWVTYSDFRRCLHFDMGGELNPLSRVEELCYKKENYVFLTHEDWDHLNFVRSFMYRIPNACFFPPPTVNKKHTRRLIKRFKNCSDSPADVENLNMNFHKTSNESSRVFAIQNILIPGDSTIRMEKIWSRRLNHADQIRVLVLGHHGSQTSTSQSLLNRLKALRAAVASARKARYGHPHRSIRKRLKANAISLLKTEDWGNIIFEVR